MYRGYIIGGVAIVFLAALFFVSPFLQDIFFAVATDVENFASGRENLIKILFVILAALSAMISPLSSTPILPVAVSLWGFSLTSTLLLFGWLLGDVIAYFIGRFAGHTIARQFVGEERLNRYETYFSEHATFLKALLVRLALPAEVGYAFGLIKYNFGAYFLITLIAEGLFAVATVQASDAFIALKPVVFAGWILALTLLISISYFFFRKNRKA